jgi:hypothetical protein
MFRAILFLSFTSVAVGLGCTQSEDDACAEDQVYEDGACKAKPASAGSDAGGTSSSGDAGSPASSEGGMPPGSMGGASTADPAFGVSCEDHSDCEAPTDYCAASPVAPAYCTAQGCDESPEICPEGWTCFDVSQFAPGEPWICMQPL